MMFTDNTAFHTRGAQLSHQIQSVTDCVNFCNDWLEKLRAVGRPRPRGKLVADFDWNVFCLLTTVFTSLPPHQYKCSKMSTFAGLTILDYKSTGEHTAIERETSCRPMLGFCLHETFFAFLFGRRESTRSFSAFDELGIIDTVHLSRFWVKEFADKLNIDLEFSNFVPLLTALSILILGPACEFLSPIQSPSSVKENLHTWFL